MLHSPTGLMAVPLERGSTGVRSDQSSGETENADVASRRIARDSFSEVFDNSGRGDAGDDHVKDRAKSESFDPALNDGGTEGADDGTAPRSASGGAVDDHHHLEDDPFDDMVNFDAIDPGETGDATESLNPITDMKVGQDPSALQSTAATQPGDDSRGAEPTISEHGRSLASTTFAEASQPAGVGATTLASQPGAHGSVSSNQATSDRSIPTEDTQSAPRQLPPAVSSGVDGSDKTANLTVGSTEGFNAQASPAPSTFVQTASDAFLSPKEISAFERMPSLKDDVFTGQTTSPDSRGYALLAPRGNPSELGSMSAFATSRSSSPVPQGATVAPHLPTATAMMEGVKTKPTDAVSPPGVQPILASAPRTSLDARPEPETPKPSATSQTTRMSATATTLAASATVPPQPVTPGKDGATTWQSETLSFATEPSVARPGGDTVPMARQAPSALFQHPDLPRHVMQQLTGAMRSATDRAADLVLNPAELGRVRISLSTAETGVVVSIVADRPETLDLMRRHIDQLAQEFRDIGYGSAEFAFGQNQPGTSQRDKDNDHSAPLHASDTVAPARPMDDPTPASAPVSLDRVDLRV
ncbi:MAG: flagellar hook-length control protein FliK [Pseudomonadota bacterium]